MVGGKAIPPPAGEADAVRKALERLGVALPEEADYAEAALRLRVLLDLIRPLMEAMPAPASSLPPEDLAGPAGPGP